MDTCMSGIPGVVCQLQPPLIRQEGLCRAFKTPRPPCEHLSLDIHETRQVHTAEDNGRFYESAYTYYSLECPDCGFAWEGSFGMPDHAWEAICRIRHWGRWAK